MAKFSEKEPEAKKDIDPFYWYTEDNIRDLLSLIPPESARVFAQTQLEHVDLLQASFRTATLQVIADGTPALIPIHLNGNHWAGAIVRRQADGKVQVIYNDPRGDALETHESQKRMSFAVWRDDSVHSANLRKNTLKKLWPTVRILSSIERFGD